MTTPPRKKGAATRGSSGGDRRKTFTRVKTAKGRKISSTIWLQRQLNDPYVSEAQRLGYRSRAAFKLLELDDKFHFLKPGLRVVDLGAAPGGWTQVIIERTKKKGGGGAPVVALDISEMEPMEGAVVLTCDFLDEATPDLLKDALGGEADVVLSDMASPVTGHKGTDHLRIIALAEVALEFALEVLADGGIFVAKVFQGGSEKDLLNTLKTQFKTVHHVKPPASRKESAEIYVVAQGFKKP